MNMRKENKRIHSSSYFAFILIIYTLKINFKPFHSLIFILGFLYKPTKGYVYSEKSN